MNTFSTVLLVLLLSLLISSANAQTKTWSRTFSFNAGTTTDKNDFVTGVIPITTDINYGGFLLAGNSNSFVCCSNDVWLMMLNQNGSIVLQKRYDTGQNDSITWIERIYDGYILTGASLRGGSQDAYDIMRRSTVLELFCGRNLLAVTSRVSLPE